MIALEVAAVLGIALLVAVVGVRIGMLVAPRLDRIVTSIEDDAPAEEAQGPGPGSGAISDRGEDRTDA